ncbi:MAG: alkane 1-monooxygenase [Rhodobacteraceae bacterium]|nr:alkane 1-monooxygenase [Paracoccaceae bacterium]
MPLRALLRSPATGFALASLTPPLLLVSGALAGGLWPLAGFLAMTLVLFLGDRITRRLGLKRPATPHDIWTERLALTLATLHFCFLAFAIFALSGGVSLGFSGWVLTFLGFGLWFGQVGNSTAHELIHQSRRLPFRFGMWVYISLLYGHHTSAHRLIHHRYVATPDDPNSASLGESFYAFAARAWPGEFRAGYEMENALRAGRDSPGLRLHPYTTYLSGAALMLILCTSLFGFTGLLAYLLLCAHAHLQLLLCDYVQHYGLERQRTGMDDYEPFGPEHSWDAPDILSGLMMLHAPRHADHHKNPARPYPELILSPEGRAPLLPASLPVMASIALAPRLWHRIMDRRVRALRQAR